MVFLNPGFLFGLFASAIPIIIHLINLRKLRKVEFSTLRFLKEIQKTKIRKVKIKQWILLLIRVLIIALLAASFARPALESDLWGTGASTSKTSAVVIIDNTPSMSIVGKEGSNFNVAKSAALKLETIFKEGDDISIIPLTADSNRINRNLAASEYNSAINEISGNDVVKSLDGAVNRAVSILANSNNYNRELYIISDFQAGLFGNDTLTNAIPDGINTVLIPVNSTQNGNYAIANIKLENQILELNKEIGFTVTVRNYSDNEIADIPLSLIINGERGSIKSITVPANSSREFTLSTTLKQTGLLNIYAELEDDFYPVDNKRYISIEVPEKIRAAVFFSSQNGILFIRAALKDAVNDNLISAEFIPFARFSSTDLSKYDILFTVGTGENVSAEKLNDYLRESGKLVFIPDNNSSVAQLNGFMKQINLPSVYSYKVNMEQGQSVEVKSTDFEHPVFDGLFNNASEREIGTPEYYSYFKLVNVTGSRSIFTLEDNSPAVNDFPTKNVILFNSPLLLSNTDLPLKGIFSPLLTRIIFYSVSGNSGSRQYKPGDKATVNIAGYTSNSLRVAMPNNAEEYIAPENLVAKKFIYFSNTNSSGFYNVYAGSKVISHFTVNVDVSESNLAVPDASYISEWFNKKGFDEPLTLDYSSAFEETLASARLGTELWRHFLIAAFILAVLEMLISRNTKKDLANLD